MDHSERVESRDGGIISGDVSKGVRGVCRIVRDVNGSAGVSDDQPILYTLTSIEVSGGGRSTYIVESSGVYRMVKVFMCGSDTLRSKMCRMLLNE